MNIETEKISGHIDEYLQFGWKYKEDETSARGRSSHTYHIVERDKDMPHYEEISALEYEYFDAKGQMTVYEPAEPWTCILLACLLVFPLFIYLARKGKEKKDVERRNGELRKEMSEAVEKAEILLSKGN